MTPREALALNIRGLGLPGCACPVTVPNSAWPKPNRAQAAAATPSLSSPAATPIRFGNSIPATVTGLATWAERVAGTWLSQEIIASWIASGSPPAQRNKIGRSSFW